MAEKDFKETSNRPAGYSALVERYDLEVVPNWHESQVSTTGTLRVDSTGEVTVEIFPAQYWPGENLGDHLEFALKYDGVNLATLASLFQKADEKDLVDYIKSKPTGKYARKAWFLYEFVTGNVLPLPDLDRGNYVDLLDPESYYTVAPARRAKRQRINDNLLGDGKFSPVVRRTETLRAFETADLSERCRKVVATYSPELLKRALGYLYSKETKSSFEIEHIKPNSTRTERFAALLQLAEREDFCERERLTELQNSIVDPRFRDSGYRSSQNYIGETVAFRNEKIHYVAPKPTDLPDLMTGLLEAHRRMEAGQTPAVIHAAVIAYGFVYLHPFEDGNGRIHRFLIHNILARRGFTPPGVMFPVSAAMQKNPAEYDASLEAFSRKLMPLVEYTLDEEGHMEVRNDTAAWYRYLDLTAQAEALFHFIDLTINTELVIELAFLANYDRAKNAIQEIVDLPDRKIDLFIRLCLQNNGRLSPTKRASHYDLLSDDEIARMEQAVLAAYGDLSGSEV